MEKLKFGGGRTKQTKVNAKMYWKLIKISIQVEVMLRNKIRHKVVLILQNMQQSFPYSKLITNQRLTITCRLH